MIYIGQPFDIVKVRMQTQTQATNALDVARKIWVNEGPFAFYKVYTLGLPMHFMTGRIWEGGGGLLIAKT